MMLFLIFAKEDRQKIPPPVLVASFVHMMLFMIVGLAEMHRIPPPLTVFPFVIVNPRMRDFPPSLGITPMDRLFLLSQ